DWDSLPRDSRVSTKSGKASKCRMTSCLLGAVIMASLSAPTAAASSAINSIPGVSTTGNNSFGTVLVAGKNLVPIPAAGTTTVLTHGEASSRSLTITNSLHSSPTITCRHYPVFMVALTKQDIRRAHTRVRKDRDPVHKAQKDAA